MLTEQTFFDKSKWTRGPWGDEPDRVSFRHTGLPCLMVRHDKLGHWCGYVGVPPGHPWHGADDASPLDISVHGGITYGRACDGDAERGVCHAPEPGEPEHAWWLGFDCAHAGDLSPAMMPHYRGEGERYMDRDEAEREVRSLAEQAASALEA